MTDLSLIGKDFDDLSNTPGERKVMRGGEVGSKVNCLIGNPFKTKQTQIQIHLSNTKANTSGERKVMMEARLETRPKSPRLEKIFFRGGEDDLFININININTWRR